MTNEHATRGKLLFLGDSHTAAGDWETWFPEHEVRNLGLTGNTTDGVLGQLDEVVGEQPAAIVLLAGGRDLELRQSVEHVVRNLEYALVALRRDLPGVRMLLQSLIPRQPEFAERMQDVNRHLRQFAPTVRAQYLDLWPVLAGEEGELRAEASDDRVGLTDEGYQIWLGVLRPAIDRLEDAPPMSGAIPVVR